MFESPLGQVVARSALPIPDYVSYLRGLTALYGVIERRTQHATDPIVTAAQPHLTAKLPFLHQDLLVFRYQLIPDRPQLVALVLNQVAQLRRRCAASPAALVGYLYAATDIAQLVTPWHTALAADSRLSGAQRYARHCAAHAGSEREALRSALDHHLVNPEQIAVAVAAAAELHTWFPAFVDALQPSTTEPSHYHSFSLNPESGNHPVCQSPAELRAALHANDRCIAEFPYYLYRYGSSAYFYGDVDGAWLAVLPHLGADVLHKQVRWLAELLASRGMPTFLQARHLQLLADELDHAVPQQSSLWALLREEATRLNPVMPPSSGLGADFAARQAAQLIRGAHYDAQHGLPDGLPNVLAWFSDPKRYTPEWIAAVKALAAQDEAQV